MDYRTLVSVFLLMSLVGCSSATEQESPIKAPNLTNSKADQIRLQERTEVEFGERYQSTFNRDGELHGYIFEASEGAEVTAEITLEGSSADLDTTLFIFGPKEDGQYGDDAIAKDDESSWGQLSEIQDLTLEESGEYIAVVGTQGNDGRGDYALEIQCKNCGWTYSNSWLHDTVAKLSEEPYDKAEEIGEVKVTGLDFKNLPEAIREDTETRIEEIDGPDRGREDPRSDEDNQRHHSPPGRKAGSFKLLHKSGQLAAYGVKLVTHRTRGVESGTIRYYSPSSEPVWGVDWTNAPRRDGGDVRPIEPAPRDDGEEDGDKGARGW